MNKTKAHWPRGCGDEPGGGPRCRARVGKECGLVHSRKPDGRRRGGHDLAESKPAHLVDSRIGQSNRLLGNRCSRTVYCRHGRKRCVLSAYHPPLALGRRLDGELVWHADRSGGRDRAVVAAGFAPATDQRDAEVLFAVVSGSLALSPDVAVDGECPEWMKWAIAIGVRRLQRVLAGVGALFGATMASGSGISCWPQGRASDRDPSRHRHAGGCFPIGP